jgi:transposase-like protein
MILFYAHWEIRGNYGDTLDFMLSERRDEEAATAFFKQAINNNGFPDKVVMDKSGANYAGLANYCPQIIVPFESYSLFQFLQSLLERSGML